MIGITAAVATLAGIVLLDLGSPQEKITTGVQADETPDGVEVSWNQQGNADRIKVRVNGEEIGELKRVNDSLVVGATEESNISLVGVSESGTEEVVSSIETENNTSSSGSTEVKDYTTKTEQITGKLSINPDINGATVKAIENSTVIDTATTDSNGEFTLNGTEESTVEFEVKGFEYTSGGTTRKVYATVSEKVPQNKEVIKDIDESKLVTTQRNGETISLLYPENANGVKQIYNLTQLQGVNGDLDGKYMLMNNIDASATSSWNGGNGFNPIGDDGDPFVGEFEGQGYTIQNLTIDRTSESRVGLFGKVGEYSNNATLSNISILNATVKGGFATGILVGEAETSTITNASSTGTVEGTPDVGGLVGYNDDTSIEDSNSAAVVTDNASSTDSSDENTGGLVGVNDGTDANISNSYATGTVTGEDTAGGLVALNKYGTISNSYATGDVEGRRDIGGLVGKQRRSSSSITGSYASGSVSALEDMGGFIAINDSGTIADSYATGLVSDTTSDYTKVAGGFVGLNKATIQNSYSEGNVQISVGEQVGGFVGTNSQGSITKSYATGNANGNKLIGGFVGYNEDSSTVSKSYAKGDSTASSGSSGGFVGSNYQSTIENVYAIGSVTGSSKGGLAGSNSDSTSTISGSYWDTETTGVTSSTGSNSGTVQTTTGLTTSEMSGSSADSNMTELDFSTVWNTTNNYPELQE